MSSTPTNNDCSVSEDSSFQIDYIVTCHDNEEEWCKLQWAIRKGESYLSKKEIAKSSALSRGVSGLSYAVVILKEYRRDLFNKIQQLSVQNHGLGSQEIQNTKSRSEHSLAVEKVVRESLKDLTKKCFGDGVSCGTIWKSEEEFRSQNNVGTAHLDEVYLTVPRVYRTSDNEVLLGQAKAKSITTDDGDEGPPITLLLHLKRFASAADPQLSDYKLDCELEFDKNRSDDDNSKAITIAKAFWHKIDDPTPAPLDDYLDSYIDKPRSRQTLGDIYGGPNNKGESLGVPKEIMLPALKHLDPRHAIEISSQSKNG